MAKVVGKVIDGMTGDNLPDTTISVYEPGSVNVIASSKSNFDGTYKVLGLPAGKYEVSAAKHGYVDSYRVPIELKSGEAKTINFILYSENAGSISGKVTDGVTGSKLAGVTVTAIGTTTGTATTDENGFYRIWGLPVGTYTVTAGKTGYEKASEDVVVKANRDLQVDFVLYELGWNYGSISGKVIDDESSEPVGGAYVSLLKGNFKIESTKTNITGDYRINDINPGTYTLKVSKSGYESCEIEIVIEPRKDTIQDVRLTKKELGKPEDKPDDKDKMVIPIWFWGVLITFIAVIIIVVSVILGVLRKRKSRYILPYQMPIQPKPPTQPPPTPQPTQLHPKMQQLPVQPPMSRVKACRQCGVSNEIWRLSCTNCKSKLG
jgi:hypothetical protein